MVLLLIIFCIIDFIGYAVRIAWDEPFSNSNTRLYPFMWVFWKE